MIKMYMIASPGGSATAQVQPFALIGNFKNHVFPIEKSVSKEMISFHTKDNMIPATSANIVTFRMRKLSIVAGVKTITSYIALSTSLIAWIRGDVYDYFYYNAIADIDSGTIDDGMYEFYIEVSDKSVFISDIFCYSNQMVAVGGDYNNDFNNDFNN